MHTRQRGLLYLVAISGLLAMLAAGTGALSAAAPNGTASITAPANNATLTGTVQVQGTATANNFTFYKLEFGLGANPTSWSVIGVLMTTQVSSGNLGAWDTTKVPDGQYTLKLTVVDNTGNYLTAAVPVTVANAGPPPAPAVPRRGCTACHVPVRPDGRYSLGWEAMNAAKAIGINHPTVSPSGISIKPTDTVGPAPCLECHGAGSGARADNGVVANLSLRDIVHPAHMFSDIFPSEFKGNCFSCHNVNNEGEFMILGQKVDVNENGIPKVLPIPGMLEPT